MENITVGRVVHYLMAVADYGEHSEHVALGAVHKRPAIVVEAPPGMEAAPGVNLMVFTDKSDGWPGSIWKTGVVEGTEPGTWHWPERVAAPAGVPGPEGKRGEPGARGAAGETGAHGKQGEKGEVGATGKTGEHTVTGKASTSGPTGKPATKKAGGN